MKTEERYNLTQWVVIIPDLTDPNYHKPEMTLLIWATSKEDALKKGQREILPRNERKPSKRDPDYGCFEEEWAKDPQGMINSWKETWDSNKKDILVFQPTYQL